MLAVLFFLLALAASADNTLLQLKSVKPKRIPLKQAIQPAAATCRHRGNEMVFSVSGDAGAWARWEIPVHSQYAVKWELAFSLKSENIASIGGRANVAIRLKSVRQNLPDKTVSAFRSMGRVNKEIGTTTFSTMEGAHTLDAIVFDLYLDRKGQGTLSLSTLELSFADNIWSAEEIDEILKTAPLAAATVCKSRNGVPILKINGVDVAPMGFRTDKPQPAIFTMARVAGLRLNRLSVNLASLRPTPGYFDYAQFNQLLDRACAGKGSWLIVDLDLTPGPGQIRRWEKAEKASFSDFSPAWRRYAAVGLRNILAAIRKHQAASKQVVGVNLATPISTASKRDRHSAYLKAFRSWLQSRYGTVAELRRSWKDEKVGFDLASPVPPPDWPTGFLGPILKPGLSRRYRDSREFYFRSRVQALLSLNRIVKDATGKQYLCGFSDEILSAYEDIGRRRYLFPGSVFKLLVGSTDVDFIEMPFAAATSPILPHLLSRAGKLCFLRAPYGDVAGKVGAICTHAETLRMYPVLTPRDAVACARGVKRAELATAIQTLGSPQTNAQIAIVVDPAVFADLGPIRPAAMPWQARTQPARPTMAAEANHRWFEIGAPFDIVPIDALVPAKYKLIIFYHTLRMTKERTKRIRAAQGGRRTIVWLWANGLLHDTGMKPSDIGKLCGMEVQMRVAGLSAALLPGEGLAGFLKTDAPEKLGLVQHIVPAFVINDKKAKVLARFSSGEPAIAVRDLGTWTSIYSALPYIDPEILRAAALKSGVKVYLTGQ